MNPMEERQRPSGYGKRYEPTTLEDVYRDGVNIDPASQKYALLFVTIGIIFVVGQLFQMMYDDYVEGIYTVEDLVWDQALLLLVSAFFIIIVLFFILATWVMFDGNLEYAVRGEVQLDIRLEPSDAWKANPLAARGVAILSGGVVIFILAHSLSSGSMPDPEIVLITILGFAGIGKAIFSRKHYTITGEGIGYLFVGFQPGIAFLPWEAFSGYRVQPHAIRIIPKTLCLKIGVMFPTKIPIIDNPDDARFILQQYIPETGARR